jgi:hypothetical protein
MKNILKVMLVVLTTAALNSIAYAGALSVSGGASARYAIMSSDSTTGKTDADKGVGVVNEFTLSASGDVNGMAWAYALDLDPSAATGAVVYDDAKLTLETGFGTLGVFASEGSLGTKYSWDPSAYGVGSDTGDGFGMIYAGNISSYDNIQYHLPSGILPLGGTFKVAHSPNGAASFSSGGSPSANKTIYDVTQYQVTLAPIDGLKISADYMEHSGADQDVQKAQDGNIGVKYSAGQFTVGYGRSYKSAALDSTTDGYSAALDTALSGYESIQNRSLGIGFQINDDLSVSYTQEKSEPDAMTAATATYEMEIQSIQAAYTMGGMTISVSQDQGENADYIQNADQKELLVAVSIAF